MSYRTLGEKLDPYVIAFGEVASTGTGKYLFARAYMANCELARTFSEVERIRSARPTRRSEDINYRHGRAMGELSMCRDSFVSLMVEASSEELSRGNALRVFNNELQMFADRDRSEQEAAPVSTLYKYAIDF